MATNQIIGRKSAHISPAHSTGSYIARPGFLIAHSWKGLQADNCQLFLSMFLTKKVEIPCLKEDHGFLLKRTFSIPFFVSFLSTDLLLQRAIPGSCSKKNSYLEGNSALRRLNFKVSTSCIYISFLIFQNMLYLLWKLDKF